MLVVKSTAGEWMALDLCVSTRRLGMQKRKEKSWRYKLGEEWDSIFQVGLSRG